MQPCGFLATTRQVVRLTSVDTSTNWYNYSRSRYRTKPHYSISAHTSFIVHNRNLFMKKVLPAFFRMSKYASFQRQLNIYGFNRITAGLDKGGKSGRQCLGR